MILWFTLAQVVLAVAAGLFCVVAGLAGRRPSDVSVGSLALVELLLIVQIVAAVIAPFAGNPPSGSAHAVTDTVAPSTTSLSMGLEPRTSPSRTAAQTVRATSAPCVEFASHPRYATADEPAGISIIACPGSGAMNEPPRSTVTSRRWLF